MGIINSPTEKLQRILFREFLLEPGLLEEVGLEEVPSRLATLLECDKDRAVETLVESPLLEALDLNQLKGLLVIRDMTLVSRTAAAVAAELKDPKVTYDQCCRAALVYGISGRDGHVFSALRVAGGKNDSYARHHYFYGLILGMKGDLDRARWELGMALQNEPYEEARIRIRWVNDVLDGRL